MALTKWEQAIYKLVREYSGATKADTEGEDLPALVDECMGELARQAEPMAAIGLAAFRAGWDGNVPIAEFVCARLAATADAPVAEPVALTDEQILEIARKQSNTSCVHQDGRFILAFARDLLTTRPPAPEEGKDAARKPLSGEQIHDLQEKYVRFPSAAYPLTPRDWVNFARAVEYAHGITDAALSASGQKGEPT